MRRVLHGHFGLLSGSRSGQYRWRRSRMVRVRGHAKVMCHLMFGMIALAADQILRLIT